MKSKLLLLPLFLSLMLHQACGPQVPSKQDSFADLSQQLVQLLQDQEPIKANKVTYQIGFVEADSCTLTYRLSEEAEFTKVVTSRVYQVPLKGLEIVPQINRTLSLVNEQLPATVTTLSVKAPQPRNIRSVTLQPDQPLSPAEQQHQVLLPAPQNTPQIFDLLLRLTSLCEEPGNTI